MSFVLEAREIGKSFGSIEVLRGVALGLEAGTVHAVIGENGAGKSTLMRILSGHLAPTRGSLFLDGNETRFPDPVAAERAGIVLVHQEILLAEDLTVAENLFLGREIRRGPLLDDRRMNREAEAALERLGARMRPETEVRRLSIADRQLVQIARALLVPHRVVVFDEPTAVLTPVEAESLFAVIRRLSEQGTAVLYISHRLNEVKAIAGKVTILRDGRLIDTRPVADLEPVEMARLMVGRDVAQLYPDKTPVSADENVLAVEDMTVPGHVEQASFTLKRGEILGFGGLIGAGRTELFEAVVGLRSGRGSVTLEGKPVRFNHARAAMAAGIVYLSEDRKGKGLLLRQPLGTNLTLAALDRFCKGPFVNAAAENAALDTAIGEFDIRTRRRDLTAGQLSGGNQQKLLLAKMMLAAPRIVIIDEPTRGVDIGTRQQIYRFIADLASRGLSIVVISSEMQELIGLCHRVLVMRNGRIAGEVPEAKLSEDAIVFLATGVHEEEAAASAVRQA